MAHHRRMHPGQSPITSQPLTPRQQNYTDEGFEELMGDGRERSLSQRMGVNNEAMGKHGRLRQKLERKYAEREKLNSDIEAMEKTLDIMGDESS